MGERRYKKSEQTRLRLLAAAEEEFSEKGFFVSMPAMQTAITKTARAAVTIYLKIVYRLSVFISCKLIEWGCCVMQQPQVRR